MDTKESLGQRLVAAVIPSRFKTLDALHRESGIAYSTVHKWKTGESNPRWEQVVHVADIVGQNPFRMLAATESRERRRVGDHPEWQGSVLRAQHRFPNRIPERFYEIAADTAAAAIPEHLDENFAFELAQFWFKHANDRELAQADTAAALRELEALRESNKLPRP